MKSERPLLPAAFSPVRERPARHRGDRVAAGGFADGVHGAEVLRRVSGEAARRRVSAARLGRENVLPEVVEVFMR